MRIIWRVLFQFIEVFLCVYVALDLMKNTQAAMSAHFLPQFKDDAQFMSHPGLQLIGQMYAVLLLVFAMTQFVVFQFGSTSVIAYYFVGVAIGDILHSSILLTSFGRDILNYPVLMVGHVVISVIYFTARILFVVSYWKSATINLQTSKRKL
eukprot:519759_1